MSEQQCRSRIRQAQQRSSNGTISCESTPKNLSLRTHETLSTQTLKGNEIGKRDALPIGFVARNRLGLAIRGFEESGRVLSDAGRTFKSRGHRCGHRAWIVLDVCRRHWSLHAIARERRTD